MESDTLEIVPKRSAKLIFIYLVCPAIIIGPGYILSAMYSSDTMAGLPFFMQAWLVLTFLFCILAGIYGMAVLGRARIVMDDTGIIARQLTEKQVPYDSIQKITVHKGSVSLSDGSFKNRISLDFMYKNLDSAISHLASNLENRDGIIFKGDKKEIEKYFGKI